MRQTLRCFILLTIAALLSSCSLFDSGVEWRGGPYVLIWIDTPDNISICRDVGEGGYIEKLGSTVFAVGWDERYLVAKQHPDGDRSKTNYFIVDSSKDTAYGGAEAVIGPLSANEYERKTIQMKLPKFSKVLDSLR